jgi:DNA-binding NarL/FixJ family response regulator
MAAAPRKSYLGGMITVLIVDDHVFFRRTLRLFLERQPELRVLAEAGSGDEAVDLAGRLDPQVVLMDIQMPRGDGVTACRAIKSARPAAGVILYSAYDSELYRARRDDAGADLLLGKQELFERAVPAIDTLAARVGTMGGGDKTAGHNM